MFGRLNISPPVWHFSADEGALLLKVDGFSTCKALRQIYVMEDFETLVTADMPILWPILLTVLHVRRTMRACSELRVHGRTTDI